MAADSPEVRREAPTDGMSLGPSCAVLMSSLFEVPFTVMNLLGRRAPLCNRAQPEERPTLGAIRALDLPLRGACVLSRKGQR